MYCGAAFFGAACSKIEVITFCFFYDNASRDEKKASHVLLSSQ